MKTVRLGIAHVGLKHATRSLTVQADVSLVRGVATTTQRDITNYGVACLIARAADEPSGYLFVVGADGTWAILRKTPQGYDSLAEWKDQADLLPASSNARVGGTCVAVPNGPVVLRLQVNGKTVHTVEDDAPLGTFRRFGVLLLTSQPNSEARFDNLSAKP